MVVVLRSTKTRPTAESSRKGNTMNGIRIVVTRPHPLTHVVPINSNTHCQPFALDSRHNSEMLEALEEVKSAVAATLLEKELGSCTVARASLLMAVSRRIASTTLSRHIVSRCG